LVARLFSRVCSHGFGSEQLCHEGNHKRVEQSGYGALKSSFQRIMVIGVTDQTAIRRNFEDEFVAERKAAGIDALRGYQFFPESGKVAEARLKEAVQRSRADGMIITRLTRVDQRREITPGFYDPPAVGIYGWYSSAWYGGLYTPPRVYSYPVFYSETTLHDVAKDEIVWSGTIRTIDPENVNDASKSTSIRLSKL
jgi:hypothetical protein